MPRWRRLPLLLYGIILVMVALAIHLVGTIREARAVRAGVLPLSLKSALPVRPWLIRFYLSLPWKPLAKQMLVRAQPDPGA